MAGHSKWKQIKHKKAHTDAKRSKIFARLSCAITLAAREKGIDPNLNPSLRSAIESAQDVNMPKDTIERAVQKALSSKDKLSRVLYEAYGPGGVAIIIEGITDNNNRTFAEIRKILETHKAKMAPGSALWAFIKEKEEWKPTTTVSVNNSIQKQLDALLEVLEERDDIQDVITNSEE